MTDVNNTSTIVQNTFSSLQRPEKAVTLMRYHDRIDRIIQDNTLTVEEKVYKIISSQLFRAISFPTENELYLKEKIHKCFEKNNTLQFILGFGAYKVHNSYSYPFPNFSEVFNIFYMKVFAYLLKKVYPYGVEIMYVPALKDLVTEITAIPLTELNQYHTMFELVFNYFVKPDDSLIYINNEEQQKKLNISTSEIKNIIEDNLSTNKHSSNDEIVVKLLKDAYIEGLTSGSLTELLAGTKKMYLYHEYYVELAYNRLLEAFPDAIAITARKKVPYYLTSTKCFYNSPVQFWVGDGIFMQGIDGNIYPTIAGKKKIKASRFLDYIKLDDQALTTISNHFKYIPLYKDYD